MPLKIWKQRKLKNWLKMVKKMNRKGMSHVEIILSFVIFVGFFIFLLAIFNPFKVVSGGEVYLDIAERGIKQNISIEVDFLTLKLNFTSNECFSFNYNSSLRKISVKDEAYKQVEAFSKDIKAGQAAEEKRKGGEESEGKRTAGRDIGEISPRMNKTFFINGGGNFFFIYSSNDFNESIFDEETCELELEQGYNYSLGLFRSYYFVSDIRLEELVKRYNSNKSEYENIKKQFGLPSGKDFVFSVRETGAERKLIIGAEKNVPKTRVLARDVPIQIVYSNGTFRYAMLNVQVW